MKTQAKKKTPRPTLAQRNAAFLATDRMWKLLEMALDDLAACERSRKFVVDMGEYIDSNYLHSSKCAVCLAGACLVKSGVGELFFEEKMDAIDCRAYCLNDLRSGCTLTAYESLQKALGLLCTKKNTLAAKKLDRYHVEYEDDRDLWWEQMQALLADLKEADL